MNERLSKAQDHASKHLDRYYKKNLFPPDRRPYLTDLRSSHGPYLGLESGDGGKPTFLQDACSQIATLGQGFNAPQSFGASAHLETWTNDIHSSLVANVRIALVAFLKRKIGWPNLSCSLAPSGSTANEMALSFAFKKRKNPKARQILAFEGSFHGRTLACLFSTWSKQKREPFEWPGHTTVFCPYPALGDDRLSREIPPGWREVWDLASGKNFKIPPSWKETDGDINGEIESLLAVRKELLGGKIFAVIIEPMQCEGGDRYSSDRFHTGLILLAHSFGVQLIYDEVQTGFHLGREFFWHREFNLTDLEGRNLRPDFVVCSKRAQVGMVLSSEIIHTRKESFSVASLIRGYYQGLMLDQRKNAILEMETLARTCLEELVAAHPTLVEKPRARGTVLAFDLKNKNDLAPLVAARFEMGLLYYPAGERTLRFRLNPSWNRQDMDFLFSRLDHLLSRGKTKDFHPPSPPSPHILYQWSSFLLNIKLALYRGEKPPDPKGVASFFQEVTGENFTILTQEDFPRYAESIMALQRAVYEPARVAPIESFRRVVESKKGWALLVVKGEKIKAMSFASLVGDHPLERGVRQDIYFDDPQVFYSIDTTLDPKERGQRLGLSLKYALYALVLLGGGRRIQGRNRTGLASSMLAVNLSLGAVEQNYLREDYPGEKEDRDTLYYTTRVPWKKEELNLSTGLHSPLGDTHLEGKYMDEAMPALVNKICLSNFASARYLALLDGIFSLFPNSLRHGYSCSGQSECVDKVAKSLWYRSKKKSFRMLTLRDHSFGRESLLAQSLTEGAGGDGFFPVDYANSPEEIESLSAKNNYLALWIEPVPEKTMRPLSKETLLTLGNICRKRGIKIIYNETVSGTFGYSRDHFFTACNPELTPDGIILFTGGQSAIVGLREECFVDKPVTMVSTWDGDEFSLGNYHRMATGVIKTKESFLHYSQRFEKKLTKILKGITTVSFYLQGHRGLIMGSLPGAYARYFRQNTQGHWPICPNDASMVRFVEEGE